MSLIWRRGMGNLGILRKAFQSKGWDSEEPHADATGDCRGRECTPIDVILAEWGLVAVTDVWLLQAAHFWNNLASNLYNHMAPNSCTSATVPNSAQETQSGLAPAQYVTEYDTNGRSDDMDAIDVDQYHVITSPTPQKLAQHLYFTLHEPGHAKRGAAQPDTDWTTLLKQLGLHSVAMDLSNMPGKQNPDATAHPEPTHDTGPHPQADFGQARTPSTYGNNVIPTQEGCLVMCCRCT